MGRGESQLCMGFPLFLSLRCNLRLLIEKDVAMNIVVGLPEAHALNVLNTLFKLLFKGFVNLVLSVVYVKND